MNTNTNIQEEKNIILHNDKTIRDFLLKITSSDGRNVEDTTKWKLIIDFLETHKLTVK